MKAFHFFQKILVRWQTRIETDIHQLRKNFYAAQQLLKRIQIGEGSELKTADELPHYWLFGFSGSGKSSLLSHSQLPFFENAQLVHTSPHHTAAIGHSNWWVTHQGVILDIPGRYLSLQSLWRQLLALTRKPTALILTISIDQLMQSHQSEPPPIWMELQKRLQELLARIQQVTPIYLLITQIDQVSGFIDFFDDLGVEERMQTLGIRFPYSERMVNFHPLFEEKYQVLLKRLNERLIWRLHQERDLKKREAIYHFPLQIEQIQPAMSRFIYVLQEAIRYHPEARMGGLFFCSSQPADWAKDYLQPILSQSFTIKPLVESEKTPKNQSFFITHLLKDIILTTTPKITNTKTINYFRPLLYGVCGIILISYISVWIHHYRQQTFRLSAAERSLAQYQLFNFNLNNQNPNMEALQPPLSQLNQAEQLITTADLNRSDFKVLLDRTYQQFLQNKFLPALCLQLEQQLLNPIPSGPAQLYKTLKAYLMLTQPTQIDAKFLLDFLQDTLTIPLATQSQYHLNQLFTHPFKSPVIRFEAVTQARQVLNQLDASTLAYLLLKDQATPQNFYTSIFFKSMYPAQLAEAVSGSIHGNWVLGKKPELPIASATLFQQVNALYLTDYANHWQQALIHYSIRNTTEFARFLKMVDENITVLIEEPASTLVPTPLLNSFQELHHWFSQNRLPILLPLIENLRHYLATTANDPHIAFLAAKQMAEQSHELNPIMALQKEISTLPLILVQPLNQFITYHWQTLLQETLIYLNDIWKKTVLPTYQRDLQDRYPLKKSSNLDVNLIDFTRFFAPRGIFDNYFQTYLKPFIDTTQARWQTKTISGQSLAIPEHTLTQLERASIIGRLYFHNRQQVDVSFTLMPIQMAKNIREMTLKLHDQTITDRPEKSEVLHRLQWSNTNMMNTTPVQLTIHTASGSPIQLTQTGPFAWFRLLDRATIQQTMNTQHFEVTWMLNGYTIKYALIADQAFNPFIPGIIDQFVCPQNL